MSELNVISRSRKQSAFLLIITGLALVAVAISTSVTSASTNPLRGNSVMQPGATQQQSTLDAIVNGYFTQTAQPELALTQTLAALFSKAQTATVQANQPTALPITSTPTPVPFDASQLEVISRFELDLIGGPANRIAVLAPDGTKFVYHDGQLCIYSIQGLRGVCSQVLRDDLRIAIDTESIRWSPDGRYVAFSEDSLRTFRDSDIWVMDTVSGSVRSYTPDPNRDKRLMRDNDVEFTWDINPQFAANSRTIYFLRYQFTGSAGNAAPTIFSVDVESSEVTRVTGLNSTAIGTYAFAVSPDDTRLVYNFDPRIQEQSGGTWLSPLDNRGSRRIAPLDPKDGQRLPFGYSFSATGRYILSFGLDPNMMSINLKPEESGVRLLSTEGKAALLVDSRYQVTYAGWSPEGEAIIYFTRALATEPSEAYKDAIRGGLFIADAPGEPGRLILEGRFSLPSSRTQMPIIWGASNVILLSDINRENKLTVISLGTK